MGILPKFLISVTVYTILCLMCLLLLKLKDILKCRHLLVIMLESYFTLYGQDSETLAFNN